MNQQRPDIDRLRSPREDGGNLIFPPLEQAGELIDANRRLHEQFDVDLGGRSLSDISRLARGELLDAARRWTTAYRDISAKKPDPAGPVILAGHQPEMFHQGVWLKNCVLGELAGRQRATAVNLIVDADAVGEAALRVPGGSADEPFASSIPFDRPEPKVAYEVRRIEDRGRFASFGRRVREQIARLVPDPLMERFWPMVCRAAERCDNLGACLAQARHQLEAEFFSGHETLEVPLSRVCQGEAFWWLVAHVLDRLAEFHAAYNQTLREYRLAHRVRSPSHPAPDLAADDDWLETPLWIWTADDPRRPRLFARREGHETILTDRQSWRAELPRNSAGAIERLLDLPARGASVRPRALLTTLWARLALGDLFIHGIGGAKYDRATDRLIRRFFGRPAPAILVVSGTFFLPVARDRPTLEEARAASQELREMTFHPERFLGEPEGELASLIAEKRRWINTPPTVENTRDRCRAIREANAAMQPWLEDRRRQLLERQADLLRRLRAESVLADRQYAFCLYPETRLRESMKV